MRWIAHVDMDCFFVAVERLKNPKLNHLPVAVGGRGRRGVIASASYEARKFGVRSAMPTAQALRLCPQLIVVQPHMSDYSEISHQIFARVRELAPVVAPVSVDEAYLDLTGCEKLFASREESALLIKQAVFETSQLVATVGVATNKLLAKIASDHAKPNGLLEIPPGCEESFLATLSIRKLPGIGPKTAYRLEREGFQLCADLGKASPGLLREKFGSQGLYLQQLARGEDDSPVYEDSERKSLGTEETFSRDMTDQKQLLVWGREMAEEVARSLRQENLVARTVQIKMRYENFETLTRAQTLSKATCWSQDIIDTVHKLIEIHRDPKRAVRLLGVSVRNLEDPEKATVQMDFFAEPEVRKRNEKLDQLQDELTRRFGRNVLVPASRKV